MKILTSSFVSHILVFFLLCTFSGAAESSIVFVSILPQKYFVEQISKGVFDVEVMVKPGASPATYEPKPSQMVKLSASLAYFAIGVPFENTWLGKISAVNPEMKIVHTDKGIEKIAMAEHHQDEGKNSQGVEYHKKNNHGHGIPDPHIWLSPILVKKQVEVILETLKIIAPEHAPFFEENCMSFLANVDMLDVELRKTFAGKEGMQFMVFHPSWGYFAREYGLKQVAIELEGKTPKPVQLEHIILHARANDIRVIFAQPQFSLKNAKLVAREIDGEVITTDPLAMDWFANLRDVAAKFKLAVK